LKLPLKRHTHTKTATIDVDDEKMFFLHLTYHHPPSFNKPSAAHYFNLLVNLLYCKYEVSEATGLKQILPITGHTT
jgi:hypothetical protein